ncbi:MAG: alpha/beta hydrolase [Boseongicola sp.]|nr:alpha/beta hydrolase [Boseongicola sp.]
MSLLQKAQPVTVNGTELAVIDTGAGDPVVLVHGGVSDLRTWSHQIGPFHAEHRTIAYSRRYHAPNIPIADDAPDPINAHVADLATLIGTLGAAPAHIVGHSWGGLIALVLAARHPGLCRLLVLIEPPVVTLHVDVPPTPARMLRLLAASPRLAFAIARLGLGALAPAERAFRRGDDRAAIAHFGRGVLGRDRFSALTEERLQQVWDNRGPERALALHDGFPDLRREALSEIATPALLIRGADSPRVFHLLIDSLMTRLPNATTLTIPTASHIAHEDAPKAFNQAVLGFLREAD